MLRIFTYNALEKERKIASGKSPVSLILKDAHDYLYFNLGRNQTHQTGKDTSLVDSHVLFNL